MSALTYSSVLLTVVRASGIALQALLVVILANNLAVPEVGLIAAALAAAALVRAVGPLGTDQVLVRLLGAQRPIQASATALCSESLALAACAGVGAASLAALAGMLIDGISTTDVLLIALTLPAYALMGSLVAQVRGAGSNLAAQLPEALGVNGGLLLTILALLTIDQLSLRSFLVSFAGTAWSVVAAYHLLRMRLLGSLAPLSASRARLLLQQSGSPFVATGVTAVAVRAPLFLAGMIGGSSTIAVMDLAIRLGSVATITTSSVGATYAVPFAAFLHRQEFRGLKRGLLGASVLAGAPAFVWVFALALSADAAFPALLPQAYQVSIAPAVVVAIGYFFNAAFGVSTTALFMADRARAVTYASVAMLGILAAGALASGRVSSTPLALAASLAAGFLARDLGSMLYLLSKLKSPAEHCREQK